MADIREDLRQARVQLALAREEIVRLNAEIESLKNPTVTEPVVEAWDFND